MKKWLYIAGLNLVFVTVSPSVQATDTIAVVDISSVFQKSAQRTAVAEQLENEFKGRDIELQSMERDLQINIQRLQRDGSTMKASERSVLEESVITQREAFSNKAQAFEQDNRRRQTEERNKLLSYIKNIVKDVATKKGYEIVIDTNAVAYSSNTKDITADVLKQAQ